MAFKPYKQTKIAYDYLIQYNKNSVTFGKDKEHKLTYIEYDKPKTKIIRYYHYDTFIGEIFYYATIDAYDIRIGTGGYSNTDRNNFNSLLACEGLDSIVKCHKQNDTLYLSDSKHAQNSFMSVVVLGWEIND